MYCCKATIAWYFQECSVTWRMWECMAKTLMPTKQRGIADVADVPGNERGELF